MTPYHPLVTTITNLLDAKGVGYKTFTHEAVRTSAEAATVRPEYSLAQGAKALIVRLKKKTKDEASVDASGKQFVQLVVPGDKKFSATKVKQELSATDIRFATTEEVSQITDGVMPGGVPPFGNLFGLSVYLDESVTHQEEIIFNAGDRRFSIALTLPDYLGVVKSTIVRIV